jgi:hypothetical protein
MKRIAIVLLAAAGIAAAASVARAAEPPSLADLSWFAGRWVDDAGGNLSEETWNGPAGDAMQGMWRYVSGGKTRLYEILAITAEEGSLVLRLRHFDARLVGWEDKTTPLVLKLVSAGPRRVAFEGPAVNGPGLVQLSYASPSDDTFVCTLEKDGKKEDFSFRRAVPR